MKKLRKISPILIIISLLFNVLFIFNSKVVLGQGNNHQTTFENKEIITEKDKSTKLELSPLNNGETLPPLPTRNNVLKEPRTPRAPQGYNGDEFVTDVVLKTSDNIEIVNGDTLHYNKEYRLTYVWDIPDTEVLNGKDTIYFTVPPEMIVDSPFSFPVNNKNGQTVGNAIVDGNNEDGYYIEMKLTSYGQSQTSLEGSFILITHVNETYVSEGDATIHFPNHDLDVDFPSQGGGGGGDGSGIGKPTELVKSGSLNYGGPVGRYLKWNIEIGRDSLLGDANNGFEQRFDSFDDIESIILEDKPENQEFISIQEAYGWESGYAYNKMFWPKSSWAYGTVEKNEFDLTTDSQGRDVEMKIDLKPRVEDLSAWHPDEKFNEFHLEYFTIPIDINSDQELKNDATITINGKDGKPPIKYRLEKTVTWSSGGGSANGTTGRAKLIKTDVDDPSIKLEDAEFDLYRWVDGEWKEENINLVTNSKGEISVSNLKIGDYMFVETDAPPGYELPESPYDEFEFEITKEDVKDEITVLVEVENKLLPDRKLLFIKEGNKGSPIKQTDSKKRAEFILQQKEGSTWKRANNEVYQVDENGELLLDETDFEKLEVDKYYRFMETKAPYGYELPDSKSNEAYSEEFHLEKNSINGKITNEGEDPVTIKMQNKKLNHQLNFKKSIEFNTGQNTPTSSEGIKFVIQGRNNGDWERYSGETFVTDKNGMIHIDSTTHPDFIQGMVDSNYQYFRFRESEVPPGRGLVDPQYPATGKEKDGKPGSDFSVAIPIDELRTNTNNGTNQIVDNLTLENKLIRYKATLKKVDSINGNQLKGAEFTIYEKDKPNDKRVIQETNGIFEIDGLVIGREYVVVESKAPEGYGARTDEYLIKLDLNNQMKVSKRDEKGNITVLEEGSNKDYTWDGTNLDLAMKVKNTAMPKMPMTGGIGVTLYTLSSLLFILIGSLLFITIKKGEKRHGKRK